MTHWSWIRQTLHHWSHCQTSVWGANIHWSHSLWSWSTRCLSCLMRWYFEHPFHGNFRKNGFDPKVTMGISIPGVMVLWSSLGWLGCSRSRRTRCPSNLASCSTWRIWNHRCPWVLVSSLSVLWYVDTLKCSVVLFISRSLSIEYEEVSKVWVFSDSFFFFFFFFFSDGCSGLLPQLGCTSPGPFDHQAPLGAQINATYSMLYKS